MSSARRIGVVAAMQGRDLVRRYVAIALMVALPLVFYFALLPGHYAVFVGGIGLAWSVSAAGLFVVLASRETDPRLVLAGYRPWELLAGRWLLLEGVAAILIGVFALLFIAISRPAAIAELVAGVALTGIVAVPLGLAIGSLLPRELEGTLAIIALVGIELSLPTDSSVAPFLPLYGPQQFLAVAAGLNGVAPPPAPVSVAYALAYTAALMLFATLLWTLRVRVKRPHHGLPSVRA